MAMAANGFQGAGGFSGGGIRPIGNPARPVGNPMRPVDPFRGGGGRGFGSPMRPVAPIIARPIASFKKGGTVPKTGVYKLHEGEKVIPKDKVMDTSIISGKAKPKAKGKLHLVPPSEGHKPKGAHGRAAVKALGRTKTTGNFKRIEKAKGKGAAVAAYQAALKAHKG